MIGKVFIPVRGVACAALLSVLAGCAVFGSNKVPPKPALTGVKAQDVAWRDAIHPSRHGGLPIFVPLSKAETAVNAAEAQPRVQEFDNQSLSQAKQALTKAQSQWQAIAGDEKRSSDALAGVARQADRAERLAEIARYTAQREIGLKTLNALQAQQAQQAQQPNSRSRASSNSLIGRRVVPDMLGPLRFQSGTARLTADSRAIIGRLAKLIAAHSGVGVGIFGFSSTAKPPASQLKAFIKANTKLEKRHLSHDQKVKAYHQGLSEARAQDVAQLLVQAGVNPRRLGARGMGATHPVASNDTAAGRRKNERAEAVIVPLQKQGS